MRTVGKILRTPTWSNLLSKNGHNKISEENDTQWVSFFTLLKSTINFKDFIDANSIKKHDLYISENNWKQLFELHECLKVAYLCNLKVQAKNYFNSEFYLHFHVLINQLRFLSNNNDFKGVMITN